MLTVIRAVSSLEHGFYIDASEFWYFLDFEEMQDSKMEGVVITLLKLRIHLPILLVLLVRQYLVAVVYVAPTRSKSHHVGVGH